MSDLQKNNQNYELDLAKGVAKADGPEDHARLLEVLSALNSMGPDGFLGSILRQNLPPAEPSAAQSHIQAPPAQEAFLTAQQLAVMSKPLNVGPKLRQAFDNHLQEEVRTLKSPRTLKEKQALFNEFCVFFGDVYLNQITGHDISSRWRPAEFSRPNQKYQGEKTSLSRLEKRRGYLSKFFEWARKSHAYMHDNPMDQRMARKKEIRAATKSYKEFTSEDLSALFGPQYRVLMDKPDFYWAPLISLFSGARLSEITDLALSDFETIDGIDAVFIPDGKTPDSKRTVPIHSVLIQLGLIGYVDFLRSHGESHLFGLRPSTNRGKAVSRQWGIWVDRCGIKDKSKVFHSFRSTAITDMHDSDTPNVAAIRQSVGHSSGTGGAHGGYIRGARLLKIRETIESLGYPTVDPANLKLEDPTFSAFFLKDKKRVASTAYAAQRERRIKMAAAKKAGTPEPARRKK